MKIKFSNENLIPYDIWFLDSTKDFHERKLLLARTKKNKTVVSLVETRIADNKVFIDTQSGIRAEKIIQDEKSRIQYTRQDVIMSRKGKPYGWTYGDNKEIHNNKGEVISIRRRRCDYYGNSEIVD